MEGSGPGRCILCGQGLPTGEGNKEGRGRGPGRADVESVIPGKQWTVCVVGRVPERI